MPQLGVFVGRGQASPADLGWAWAVFLGPINKWVGLRCGRKSEAQPETHTKQHMIKK